MRTGYRLIDSAWGYDNGDEVGAALRELFKQGVIGREDVVVGSKVSFSFRCFSNFSSIPATMPKISYALSLWKILSALVWTTWISI